MDTIFKTWTSIRKPYLNFFDNYSTRQLNETPGGFSNNLIWNIRHIIVAQQKLIYKDSNLPGYVPDGLAHLYNPETEPSREATQEEPAELKGLLIALIGKTIKDFQKGIFKAYNERTSAKDFHLAYVTDALVFNNYHEGLHLGYMMCIRKFI